MFKKHTFSNITFFQSVIPPSLIDLELVQKMFLVVLLGAYQPVFIEGGFFGTFLALFRNEPAFFTSDMVIW